LGADGFIAGAGYEPEGLDAADRTDRDDHMAADGELLDQGLAEKI
jgi:hypothetical protein